MFRYPCQRCGQLVSRNALAQASHAKKHAREDLKVLAPQVGEVVFRRVSYTTGGGSPFRTFRVVAVDMVQPCLELALVSSRDPDWDASMGFVLGHSAYKDLVRPTSVEIGDWPLEYIRAEHPDLLASAAGLPHTAQPYPHAGGCPQCYALGRCNGCGGQVTQHDRCTNGRCPVCHRDRCTPGNAHGFGKGTMPPEASTPDPLALAREEAQEFVDQFPARWELCELEPPQFELRHRSVAGVSIVPRGRSWTYVHAQQDGPRSMSITMPPNRWPSIFGAEARLAILGIIPELFGADVGPQAGGG
jgi:hypothetical protein